MPVVPYQLKYVLTRRQRLTVLLRLWGIATTFFKLVVMTFFVLRTIEATITLEWMAILVFGALTLLGFLVNAEMILGLLNIVFVRQTLMDIEVEENEAHILMKGERWVLFLDGITEIQRLSKSMWTVFHWNGFALHIPVGEITDEQMQHLRSRMEFGKTQEGFDSVVERGKMIQAAKERIHEREK